VRRTLGAWMAHTPDWHILDTSFVNGDSGLALPARTTALNGASLEIQNLDRSDPPGYRPGGVPRSADFNRNLFHLGSAPCMPAIPVQCAVAGFDPATSPIYWRLVCRHLLCRYRNTGAYRYQSICETFEREWRGQSRSASFTIFGDATADCSCTYSDQSRVLGGHALLEVAAHAGTATLADYVHLRIGGTNPSVDDVCNYLHSQWSGFDRNTLYMLQAVFRHESRSTQFNNKPQGSARMTFTKMYHDNASQPDCTVQLTWPADPAHFPLASFDFGVGISQFTEVGSQKVTAEIAWDWRENVRQSANLFLGKLQHQFTPGMTWMEWAMKAWAAYNGSGPRAQQYAQEVAKTSEAAKVSTQPVPALPTIAQLPPLPPLQPPGEWLLA